MPRKDVSRTEGKAKIQSNPAAPETAPAEHAGNKPDAEGKIYGAGKHFRDTPGGPSDLERNPGIHSSPGTFASGESGVKERDEGGGITPREK